jgi:hypothetical protein
LKIISEKKKRTKGRGTHDGVELPVAERFINGADDDFGLGDGDNASNGSLIAFEDFALRFDDLGFCGEKGSTLDRRRKEKGDRIRKGRSA